MIAKMRLERSAHDRPGKIVAYVAACVAKAAIWVVPEAPGGASPPWQG